METIFENNEQLRVKDLIVRFYTYEGIVKAVEKANLRLRKGETLDITVRVKNTGPRSGKEVVHLFVSDLYRSVTPPVRQLKGFTKVELAPGEEKTVRFTLASDDLSFVGRDNKRIVEPGRFRVTIGKLEREFELLE